MTDLWYGNMIPHEGEWAYMESILARYSIQIYLTYQWPKYISNYPAWGHVLPLHIITVSLTINSINICPRLTAHTNFNKEQETGCK